MQTDIDKAKLTFNQKEVENTQKRVVSVFKLRWNV